MKTDTSAKPDRVVVHYGWNAISIRAEGSIRGAGMEAIEAAYLAAVGVCVDTTHMLADKPTMKSPRGKPHRVNATIFMPVTERPDVAATAIVATLRRHGIEPECSAYSKEGRAWLATIQASRGAA